MILQILHILLISLGLGVNNNQPPKHSLHRQPEYKTVNITPMFIVLFIGGIIVFAGLLFCFMPGTESGLVYYHPGY